jgi:uncharacterized membrane protein YvlD (DUF360 family)
VIRLIVRMGIALAGNAVGLLVAAAVLDRMHVNATSFLVAVVIFTTVLALLQPFIVAQVRRAAPPLVGGVALIATFVSLLITTIVSDGLSISGLSTWIAATVIVWIGSLLAVFILPYLGLRKYLEVKRAS